MKKTIILLLALVMAFGMSTMVVANPNNVSSLTSEGVTVTVRGGGNNLVITAQVDDGVSEVVPRQGNGTFQQTSELSTGHIVFIRVQGNSLRELAVLYAPAPAPTNIVTVQNHNTLSAYFDKFDEVILHVPTYRNLGINGSFVVPAGKTLIIRSPLNVGSSGTLVIEGTLIVEAPNGRLNNQGNGSTIEIAAGGALINENRVENVTGSILRNNGTIVNSGNFQIRAGVTFYNIDGIGTVVGDLTIHRDAIVNPAPVVLVGYYRVVYSYESRNATGFSYDVRDQLFCMERGELLWGEVFVYYTLTTSYIESIVHHYSDGTVVEVSREYSKPDVVQGRITIDIEWRPITRIGERTDFRAYGSSVAVYEGAVFEIDWQRITPRLPFTYIIDVTAPDLSAAPFSWLVVSSDSQFNPVP